MLKSIISVIILISISGCAGDPSAPSGQIDSSAAKIKPTNYDAGVKAYIRETFFDPDSIKDAEISDPFWATIAWDNIIPQNGWTVCLLANGKNRFGAYTGRQYTALLIEGSTVKASVNDAQFGSMAPLGQAHQNCPGRHYSQFKL